MTALSAVTRGGSWSEQAFRDALEFVAQGLTELVGFGMAVISVRHGDELVVVAVAGVDEVVRRPDGTEDSVETMLGSRWPVSHLEDLLAASVDWGRFRFVPHDRVTRASWMWVRESTSVDGPDAWHPNDGALAPIHDETGALVGALSVDEPSTGRLPDEAQRRVMDKYAAEASKVVLAALEREALERRLELAAGARQLVRTASRQVPLPDLIDETGPAFLEAFAASGLWLRMHDSEGPILAGSRHALPVAPTEELSTAVTEATELLWARRQAALLYTDGRTQHAVLDPERLAMVREGIEASGYGSVLHAPIGAGDQCLGAFVLTRDAGAPDWSEAELAQAAEVGRDLGRIISNGRTFARAQDLVRRLFELDAYKSHLIATISHELKNPLTVLTAHRDLLEPELTTAEERAALATIDAETQRMNRVVDNLLVLARLADPDIPHRQQDLDLHDLLDDVRLELAPVAVRYGVALRIAAPASPLLLRGDAGQLRTMLANLVDNGLKFSDGRGSVEVSVVRTDTGVEVAVIDAGIGIAESDRARLFTDFFRAADPAVRSRPGSGLGLTIVDRIVRRHGGRISVDSRVGGGSTFRVWLPGG